MNNRVFIGLVSAFLFLLGGRSSADACQLEMGTVSVASTFGAGTWTTHTFDRMFNFLPAVFVIPNQQGGDPAIARINNVTTTGFDIAIVEPPGNDGPHLSQTITYVAVSRGSCDINGTLIDAQCQDISTTVSGTGGGANTWTPITFNTSFTGTPILLGQIQSDNSGGINDPNNAPTDPWLTTAAQQLTSTGVELSLERSETAGTGTPVSPEYVCHIAIEEKTFSFDDNSGTNTTCETINSSGVPGWDDGCVGPTYSSIGSNPLGIAFKTTRNGGDGGWLRTCTVGGASSTFTVDEDIYVDTERNHTNESIGFFGCDRAFHVSVTADVHVTEIVSTKDESTGKHVLDVKTTGEKNVRSIAIEKKTSHGQWVSAAPYAISSPLSSLAGSVYRFANPVEYGDGQYRVIETMLDESEAVHGPFAVKTKNSMLTSADLQSGSKAKKVDSAIAKTAKISNLKKGDNYVIRVDESGWVKLTAEELEPQSELDLLSLKRAIRDQEYAVYVDGVLLPLLYDNGAIFFYSHQNDNHLDPSNHYILKRGVPALIKKHEKPTQRGRSAVLELESTDDDDLFPVLAYAGSSNDLGYRTRVFSGDSTSQDNLLTLEAFAPVGESALTIAGLAVGHAEGQALSVSLNGEHLEDVPLSSNGRFLKSFTVRDGALLDLNDIHLKLNQGGVYVDGATLDYQGVLSGQFKGIFAAPTTMTLFMPSDVDSEPSVVLDVTDPLGPSWVGVLKNKKGFSIDVVEGHRYAFVSEAILPAAIRSKAVFTSKGAEHVVLTSGHMMEAAEELVAYREEQGLASEAIALESLYDAFGFGNPSGDSLSSYLQWRQAEIGSLPKYVVLVGDLHFDAGGIYDSERPDMAIPLTKSPYGWIHSDMQWSDIDKDDIPDLSVGHIPASSKDELLSFVDKIKTYESLQQSNPAKESAHISGARATAGDFKGMLDDLEKTLPESISVNTFSLDNDDSMSGLYDTMSRNNLWTFLAGHGSMDRLTGVLAKEDVPGVPESNPSFMAWFSCLSHRGELPGFQTLAESLLLNTRGGAIASFGPTSLTSNGEARNLSKILADNMLYGKMTTVGDVALSTLQEYGATKSHLLTLKSYTLLGDPATKINLPKLDRPIRVDDDTKNEPGAGGCSSTGTTGSAWLLIALLALFRIGRRHLNAKPATLT